MWAHGKFLTDSQAQAIINKIDQKQDGKVKHKFQSSYSQILTHHLKRDAFQLHHFIWALNKMSHLICHISRRLKQNYLLQKCHRLFRVLVGGGTKNSHLKLGSLTSHQKFVFYTLIIRICIWTILINNDYYKNFLLQVSKQDK